MALGKRGECIMFSYNKFLEFPINIKHKNPRLANIVATQYGGADGKLFE